MGALFSDGFKVSKKIKLSLILLIIISLLGIGMYFFPQDPRHIEMSFKGKIHLVLAGLASISTMAAIISAGMNFIKKPTTKKLGLFSFMIFVILFITGGLGAVTVANDSPVGGLFERFTIGSFILWIAVLSIIILLNRKKTIASQSQI